jgi:hypothetical protein
MHTLDQALEGRLHEYEDYVRRVRLAIQRLAGEDVD